MIYFIMDRLVDTLLWIRSVCDGLTFARVSFGYCAMYLSTRSAISSFTFSCFCFCNINITDIMIFVISITLTAGYPSPYQLGIGETVLRKQLQWLRVREVPRILYLSRVITDFHCKQWKNRNFKNWRTITKTIVVQLYACHDSVLSVICVLNGFLTNHEQDAHVLLFECGF